MQASISSICTERRRPMLMLVLPLSKSRCNSSLWSVISSSRWSIERTCVPRPWKSTWKKDPTWMQLSIRWLKRIMKWFESTRWSRSRASKIWFSQSTRKKLFSRDKKSWRNTKKNWLGNLPLSNRNVPIIFRLWKRLQRHSEKPYLANLPKRKPRDEQSRSMLKISGTICKSKKWRNGSEQPREMQQQRN